MFFLRWIPTFLAFSLGELIASAVVGAGSNPLTALATGAVVGAVVGTAQWLALGRLVDRRWAAVTCGATAAGGMAAMMLVGPADTAATGLVTGLVAGAAVGFAQAPLLRRGRWMALVWGTTVAASWGAAGLAGPIDGSHALFGSNAALAATVVTGIVLRIIVGPRLRRRPVESPETTRTMDVAASVIAARREAGRPRG